MTNKTSNNNKRIAKNTMMLYIRMALTMIVSLYTSRVVLASLGIEDFGIYNVVGGVIGMFGFLNGSMASTTQRFLNYALGKGDSTYLNKIFSLAFFIHLGIAIIVLVLCETVGLWFLNYKLVIPDNRMWAANIVFQVSMISSFLAIVGTVFNGCIIAHEKMGYYAYVSIYDTFVKLAIAYLISIVSFDRLIFYAILLAIVSITSFLLPFIMCLRQFSETKIKWYKDTALAKDMFGFSGWNIFGSLSWLLRDQGVNMLINIFLGPIANASRAVAVQVSNAIQGFVSNFMTAMSPQITKNYASGKLKEMETLAYRGSRFSFLLLFMIALPFMLNSEYILHLWLKEVPKDANSLVILTLIDCIVNAVFGVPLITSLMATGNIKKYQISVSSIMLLIVPIGYVTLSLGLGITSVFYGMICISIVSGILRYIFCMRMIGYHLNIFIRKTIIPILLVTVFCVPTTLFVRYEYCQQQTFLTFIILCSVATLLTVSTSLLFGMSSHERNVIFNMISKKL